LKFNALSLQSFEEAKSARQVMLATDDQSCKHWYSQRELQSNAPIPSVKLHVFFDSQSLI